MAYFETFARDFLQPQWVFAVVRCLILPSTEPFCPHLLDAQKHSWLMKMKPFLEEPFTEIDSLFLCILRRV